MIIFSILGCLAAIGIFCWLLFTLAVFALPFLLGLTAVSWAYGTGAGWIGAIVVGLIAAGAIFAIGQFLLIVARPLWLKLLVAFAFVAPAVVAGYAATYGIVKHVLPSQTWQLIFSGAGAIAVGIVTFVRLATLPEPSGRGPVGL
ncbi:hypothetical protein EZH22_11915 [Xanthobacter dioxanivorans]|uniref:DUF4175 domain-containing protein n=1 Tax=Xanthobacter dioxanivorans TaxID=2528964 RepID=A0A974PSG4_9HYPH|nr:hypothetical protein [Xanthobacter dioxanivorans]QRG08909.1 hypothetical protein EZH22_11915 [Xanthobacter dioxanivorans]